MLPYHEILWVSGKIVPWNTNCKLIKVYKKRSIRRYKTKLGAPTPVSTKRAHVRNLGSVTNSRKIDYFLHPYSRIHVNLNISRHFFPFKPFESCVYRETGWSSNTLNRTVLLYESNLFLCWASYAMYTANVHLSNPKKVGLDGDRQFHLQSGAWSGCTQNTIQIWVFKMAPKVLYTTRISPAGRAVEITAKILGLELDIKFVDLAKREHLTEEFLKVSYIKECWLD